MTRDVHMVHGRWCRDSPLVLRPRRTKSESEKSGRSLSVCTQLRLNQSQEEGREGREGGRGERGREGGEREEGGGVRKREKQGERVCGHGL